MASNAPRYAKVTARATVPQPKGVRHKAARGQLGPQSPKGRNNIAYFQQRHRYAVTV